ncbi:MAG: hypothetical protein E7614_01215 [Ruminococcaceae bacterium]|nr:hypothetical protein [Oscillospiraceae bacterium]
MKEIDIIKHAKSYMDMLSKGINPITKKEYSETSDLNNERLIKCFEFVSVILERVITEEMSKEQGVKATQTTSDDTFPPNSIVPDELMGKDVVKTLIEKGLLKQGINKKN